MSWRPDDWRKKKDDWYRHSAHGQILDGMVYEAGADAMLEALRAISIRAQVQGAWILFIPDRQVDEMP